jgi:hypothetical protein
MGETHATAGVHHTHRRRGCIACRAGAATSERIAIVHPSDRVDNMVASYRRSYHGFFDELNRSGLNKGTNNMEHVEHIDALLDAEREEMLAKVDEFRTALSRYSRDEFDFRQKMLTEIHALQTALAKYATALEAFWR